MTERHTGSCLCGAVRFTVTGPLSPGLACHCTMCRKQTGMFLASTEVDRTAVEITGEEDLRWYDSGIAHRGFCSRCGSVLFWREKGTHKIAPTLGSVDGPTGVRIEHHIYVADKGDYYEVDPEHPAKAG